jgi:hypothetical protein
MSDTVVGDDGLARCAWGALVESGRARFVAPA